MAEAPPNGLFWASVHLAAEVAEWSDGHLVIDLVAHGPAGSSSVELSDGGVIEVDHLDPSRLVGVQADAADPASSALLVALFGGDGALQIADAAVSVGGDEPQTQSDPDDPWSAGPGRTPRQVQSLDLDAQRTGRLVVLADLSTDPAAGPLARAVASAELVGALDATPGGDLFAPAAPRLASRALELLRQVSDDELIGLDPKLTYQLISVLHGLGPALLSPKERSALVVELRRLRDVEPDVQIVALMEPQVRQADAGESFGGNVAADALAVPASEPVTQVLRRSPALLEVTVPRDEQSRWVRVLRTDGLVALAQAPLQRSGLIDRAELLVPPDTHTADLHVQVLDADQLLAAAGSATELFRRAVRLGRSAASAERDGNRPQAMRRWQKCGELWDQLGDRPRSMQARGHASRSGRVLVEPLLADRLDPYGVDAEIEGVEDW